MLVLILSVPAVRAQDYGTVRGFVTSASDGQPLLGVNVVLQDATGGLQGAATDGDGFYAISRVPPGTYTLRATFIGFETFTDTLTLSPDQVLTRNIELDEAQAELGEVVVESEREATGAAGVTAGLQTVRPSDIELIPAPDISADLVNYLTTLPGVVSQGDTGGQFFIRGGEPTQNLVLLDGMLVYQPFHVVGFFSIFPAEVINTADVHAGGFGARFGGRLSSVVNVATRNGNNQQFAGSASVAPFVSTLQVEGPIVPGRVSLLASVRQSVIEQGAERIVDDDLPFSFGDRFAKVNAQLTDNSRLSITGLHTNDKGRLGVDPLATESDAENEVRWGNAGVGLRYIFLPSNFPIFAEILLSTSRFENELGPEADPERFASAQRTGAAAHVTHSITNNFDLNWGLALRTSRLESRLGGTFQNLDSDTEFVTEAAAYLEPDLRLRYGLELQPGVRVQTFPSKSRTFVEPRLRMVWNAGAHRLSMGGGFYSQEIVGLNDRRDAGNVFTAWTASPLNVVPEALHLIAGYRLRATRFLDLSIEGFYKDLDNLVIPELTAFPRFTTRMIPAEGEARGLDLRAEVQHNSFYGFVSYGLSEVEYTARQESFGLSFGTEELTFSPPHDRRHQVNALANLSLDRFDVNVRWQFGSGLPFSRSAGFDSFILLDSLVHVTEEPGQERVLYARPFDGRLPTFHRFDASVSYTFPLGRRADATIQSSVVNAYDRRNLFFLDLFTLRRVDQLPLIPSLGLKVSFN